MNPPGWTCGVVLCLPIWVVQVEILACLGVGLACAWYRRWWLAVPLVLLALFLLVGGTVPSDWWPHHATLATG